MPPAWSHWGNLPQAREVAAPAPQMGQAGSGSEIQSLTHPVPKIGGTVTRVTPESPPGCDEVAQLQKSTLYMPEGEIKPTQRDRRSDCFLFSSSVLNAETMQGHLFGNSVFRYLRNKD